MFVMLLNLGEVVWRKAVKVAEGRGYEERNDELVLVVHRKIVKDII
jgi:hypothetical protein